MAKATRLTSTYNGDGVIQLAAYAFDLDRDGLVDLGNEFDLDGDGRFDTVE